MRWPQRVARLGLVSAVAYDDWPARELLVARAEAIAERFGLPAKKWVKLMGLMGGEAQDTAGDGAQGDDPPPA